MAPYVRPFVPRRSLIGMIHVGALPGTPTSQTTPELLASAAAEEARLLADAGFDALIVENMHDVPYVVGDDIGPEITASMTRVALEIESAVDIPFGVQILALGNRQAIAVAQASGGSFVRCENFVFSHVADEGLLAEAEAGQLLRYRKQIDSDEISIYADIKKKHASHALTADLPIEQAAEAAEFFGASGVIVTGDSTARPADLDELRRVKEAVSIPVLIGSGATTDNARSLLEYADAIIVGSSIKHDGLWSNPVDADRARAFVDAAKS